MTTKNGSSLSQFPQKADNFQIPQTPGDTYLSEAEADSTQSGNTLNHPQMHQAENEAIANIENNVALANHNHSDPQGTDYSSLDPSAKHGMQLDIQNTHVTSDTKTAPTAAESASPDSSASTWHHTVGTSPSSIGQYQAVSGEAWNAVGLNSVPNGFLTAPSPSSISNLPSQVASNQSEINGLKTASTASQNGINAINGQLSAFNNFYQQRAVSFLGQSFETIAFTPDANIKQANSGGTVSNWIKVNLFARIAWLQIHSFFSAHNGVDAQVQIFTQVKQPDGSWWAPNYLFFFPMAIFMQSQDTTSGYNDLEFTRDITWQPDGNIVTSSLGNPGEFNMVFPCSIPFPDNVELVHYDSAGNPIEYTNLNPFNV